MATLGMATNVNIDGPPPVLLTVPILARFKPSKVFNDAVEAPSPPAPGRKAGTNYITGLCFDDRGETLVTSGDDETFRVYNTRTGKFSKTFMSKKYGIDLPRFTHRSTNIIYASTKEDDTIRYHSLHDNKYLQYFRGHKKRVVSLQVSPIDDTFVSASLDNTVRLWDLRTSTSRGLLNLPSSPVVTYDTSGMVFAVALNKYSRVLMYDAKNFDKQPFTSTALNDPTLAKISFPPRPLPITSMEFSSNGSYLLVGTAGHAHYILDAFGAKLMAKLEGHKGLDPSQPLGAPPSRRLSGEEVCFTADSKYVLSGSEDGKIYVWDLSAQPLKPIEEGENREPEVLRPVAVLEGHAGPSRCVKFNPRFVMMATASNDLTFWLPDGSTEVESGTDKEGDTRMQS